MSDVSTPRRRAIAGSVTSILCVLSGALAAGQGPVKKLSPDRNYQTFTDPAGRFQLEYPKRDWRPLPSVPEYPIGGSSLAVFARTDGATLFVDRLRLVERLTPGEIDAMPEVEMDRLRKLQPNAKDFKSDMVETEAGRGMLIRYSRVETVPESVVQFSIPLGQDLYRLNGIVPEKLFTRYEPIIMRMIQSFKAPADPSSPKN